MEAKVSSIPDKNLFSGILYSMRPKHWTKNLLLFAGIIFSQNIFNLNLLLNVVSGFFVFSLVSGCAYLVNDINDIDEDRKHPKKRYRPLSSGQISIKQAIFAIIFILIFSITVAFIINIYFGLITLAYFLIITLYSFYLKYIVILDVFTIAFGFLLRAIAGVVIIGVNISPWLIVCTILLALFLALSKRRHEISILKDEAGKHRKVLKEYSIPYLDQMITIVTAGTIIVYSLYTFYSDKNDYLMATIPFVIYGIFRYLYLIHQHDKGGNPEEILIQDKPLIIDILFWGITSSFIIYFT